MNREKLDAKLFELTKRFSGGNIEVILEDSD